MNRFKIIFVWEGGITLSKDKKSMLNNVEKTTGVGANDILKVANSLQGANLRDETTLRNLINHLAKLTNRKVSKELEDKIVDAVSNNKVNPDTISKMINKK
jgi:ABC-type tungstate transport system permease subunit